MEKVSKYKRLQKKISKYEYISFDVFDTLIKRNCYLPTDIFSIVEKKYNKLNLNQLTNFTSIRIEAERIARENSNTEDVNLDEIYAEITTLEKKQIDILKKLEIETELQYCEPNLAMQEIYEYCLKKNKKIICISDMYLGKKEIDSMLKKCGYTINDLYVSSEYGLTKRSGNLFKIVLKEKKLKKSNILHIGDSKRADFLVPRLLGCKSYLLRTKVNNMCFSKYDYTEDLNFNITQSFINNKNDNNNNIYEKIGYEILGPMIYSFCNWLHSYTQEAKIDKLLFCARDMKLIQEAYNQIYGDNATENDYFYISRKSIKMPYLHKNNSFPDFITLVTDKKMTIREMLKTFNITLENLEEILEKYNLSNSVEYNHHTLLDNVEFQKFYEENIKSLIKIQSKEQYEYFTKYFESLFKGKRMALVDLGWRGTIQYSLQKIYKNLEIKGLYFGLEPNCFNEIKDSTKGYAFDHENNIFYNEYIYSFRSLFELFFCALHGSTIEYTDKEIPYVLGDEENSNNEVIMNIQNGALKFIRDFKKYYDDVEILSVEAPLMNLINIGINPTYEQACIFGDLNFDNMITGKLAKPQPLLSYIFRPKQLIRDIFRSEWKVGFLKRLLRINLPYYKVYTILKNKKNGKIQK